jgi:hypothetical protein
MDGGSVPPLSIPPLAAPPMHVQDWRSRLLIPPGSSDQTRFQSRPASWASRLQQASCKLGTAFRERRSCRPDCLATVDPDAPRRPSHSPCIGGRSFEKPGNDVVGAQAEDAGPCHSEQPSNRQESCRDHGSKPVRILAGYGRSNFEICPHDFPRSDILSGRANSHCGDQFLFKAGRRPRTSSDPRGCAGRKSARRVPHALQTKRGSRSEIRTLSDEGPLSYTKGKSPRHIGRGLSLSFDGRYVGMQRPAQLRRGPPVPGFCPITISG